MIELCEVTKSFGHAPVVNGVSLRFRKGEVVALLGPSGCGKTTLLRCLIGLERFDSGTIRIGELILAPGRRGNGGAALAKVRGKVGFVFQQWHLFAHRTALGNVTEGPRYVLGVSRADAVAKGRELLAKVGLSHREGAYPHELSGGEQQRAAIARALSMEPAALLLDEPTSALDPERSAEVRELLARLAREGTTLIVVTHDTRFARQIAHRAVVLSGGMVVEDGPVADVLDRPVHPRTQAYLGMGESGDAPPSARLRE